MNKNLLFVTSRNAYSTSGELRLIKNRASVLKENFGIETDVILFRHKNILKRTQEILGVGEFRIVTYSFSNYLWGKRHLLDSICSQLNTGKYHTVVISGVNVLFVIGVLKKKYPTVKFIADLHGAFEELIEFPGNNMMMTILRKLLYKYAKHNEKKYLPLFDSYFVVSNSLKNYIQKEYNINQSSFFIIPCAISETRIDEEQVNRNRNDYRLKYGIKNNEILFVYSGGVSPWQCIEESVDIYRKIKRTLSQPCRLLLMSNRREYLEKFSSPDIIIDSYPSEEVRKVLCACDYAFLLRGNFVTNNVAYPNKFLEYISCGLKVVATDNVYDVADQIKKYKLGVCVSLNEQIDSSLFETPFTWLGDIEQRNKLLEQTSFKTTLKSFVESL